MRAALILMVLSPVWAQTTAGPVTQIVTGGTVKVSGGTPVVSSGTPVVSGGTTVIGGSPVWTEIQSKWSPVTPSGTTITVTLNSAPTAGNLVVCGIMAVFTTATISDNASTPNVYTLTPKSPSKVSPSSTYASVAYLVAPGGAGATITATLGAAVTVGSAMGCEEFHLSVGTPAFDKDAAGNGIPPTTSATTPSITPSTAGELLVGVGYFQLGYTSAGSPWTLWAAGGLATNGANGAAANCGSNVCPFGDEVILSSSVSATALNFITTRASIGYWNSLIAAFN